MYGCREPFGWGRNYVWMDVWTCVRACVLHAMDGCEWDEAIQPQHSRWRPYARHRDGGVHRGVLEWMVGFTEGAKLAVAFECACMRSIIE